MAATCGTALSSVRLESKLVALPRTAAGLASSSCGINNGAFRAVELRATVPVQQHRKPLHVVAMAPPKPAGKAKKGIPLLN